MIIVFNPYCATGIRGPWMIEGSRGPVCSVHYAVAEPGDTVHTSNKCFVAIMAMLGGNHGGANTALSGGY